VKYVDGVDRSRAIFNRTSKAHSIQNELLEGKHAHFISTTSKCVSVIGFTSLFFFCDCLEMMKRTRFPAQRSIGSLACLGL